MATPKSPWPIRINIVDLGVWKPYADGGDLSEWASDNAYDSWREYLSEYLGDYVQDVLKAAKVRWKISSEDLDRVTASLKEDRSELETVFHAILDAGAWAWEEAYIPTDGDITWAIEAAAEDLYQYATLDGEWANFLGTPIKNRGPEDWDPREKKYSEAQLFDELEEGVSYERKENDYDRFLVIDWSDGPIVKYLEAETQKLPDPSELEHFHWNLKDLVDAYKNSFEKRLEKVMEGRDPGNRVDFAKHWKQMLADKSTMKHAAAEIKEFLGRSAAS